MVDAAASESQRCESPRRFAAAHGSCWARKGAVAGQGRSVPDVRLAVSCSSRHPTRQELGRATQTS